MSSAALAQRRHGDRQHVEAVIQVFAEAALADQRLQVLVRGGDDAHVHLHRVAGADALERHLLEHAQQLDLHLRRHVADLVQEQRAAVGRLEPADLVADGVGESPLDVAEQFTFQQAGRQVGAMDLDERLAGPRAVVVDGAGQQPLAGAALAAQQHRRRRRRHLAHQMQAAAAPAGWSRPGRRPRPGVPTAGRVAPGAGLGSLGQRLAAGELALQRDDAPVLLRDLFDLRLQLAVERVDGAVAFGADQGQGGDLGEGRQQVQVLRRVRPRLLGAQHEQAEQLALVQQAVGRLAAEEEAAAAAPGPTASRSGAVADAVSRAPPPPADSPATAPPAPGPAPGRASGGTAAAAPSRR